MALLPVLALGALFCGGQFITHLARSYGLLVPVIIRSMTCMDGHKFSMGHLETMRVVQNYGTH